MYDNVKAHRAGMCVAAKKWKHISRRIDDHEIIIVLSGAVHIKVEEEEHSLYEGDILHIRPGEWHGGTRESDGVSFYWIHLEADDEDLPPRTCHPDSPERILLLSRELLHYLGAEGYPPECADAAARLILAEIAYGTEERDTRITARIKEYIRRGCGRPIRTAELARVFGYNADHLNRIFKSTLGIGIKSYIDKTRMNMIKEDLLQTDLTLAELARKYQFSDYKYLLKFFKYHEGMSPKRYRETYYILYTN